MSVGVPTIPTDSPSIFDQLTTLDRRAIVRPDNPPLGIAGFLFDYDSDQMLELMSEITDNPIEDNTSIQDNIALLPERVILKGLIAELTDAGLTFPTPPAQPAPLPLFPGLFPPFAIGANLSFSAQLGALGINAGAQVGIGQNGKLQLTGAVSGALGPFSADAIVRTVTGELGGVIALDANVSAAVNAAINSAVKSISGGNSPTSAAIAAAINSAVGNVIGSALTPDVTALVVQSVNSSISTTTGTNPGPSAAASSSLYQYYLNRAQVQEGETAQNLALGYFYQMWRGRQLFSIETPWGIMSNMAIMGVRAEQPEESKSSTAFSVTFKKIRIARSITVNLGQLAGRNAFQAAADTPAQNGTSGQTPATAEQETSWLRNITGDLRGLQGLPPSP